MSFTGLYFSVYYGRLILCGSLVCGKRHLSRLPVGMTVLILPPRLLFRTGCFLPRLAILPRTRLVFSGDIRSLPFSFSPFLLPCALLGLSGEPVLYLKRVH